MGIARWDENDNQGWKRLGVPTVIRHKYKDGPELDMGAIINTVLQDGGSFYYLLLLLYLTYHYNFQDSIFVLTSLTPAETSY